MLFCCCSFSHSAVCCSFPFHAMLFRRRCSAHGVYTEMAEPREMFGRRRWYKARRIQHPSLKLRTYSHTPKKKKKKTKRWEFKFRNNFQSEKLAGSIHIFSSSVSSIPWSWPYSVCSYIHICIFGSPSEWSFLVVYIVFRYFVYIHPFAGAPLHRYICRGLVWFSMVNPVSAGIYTYSSREPIGLLREPIRLTFRVTQERMVWNVRKE